MVATNDGLYSVGVHQIIVGVAIGGLPARMLSLWSHLSYERSTKVFSAKSYFSPIRESFLPRKFPAIRYYGVHVHAQSQNIHKASTAYCLLAQNWILLAGSDTATVTTSQRYSITVLTP